MVPGEQAGVAGVSLIDGVGGCGHHIVGKVPKVDRVQQVELIAAEAGGDITDGGLARAAAATRDVVVLLRVEGGLHFGDVGRPTEP